MFILSYICVLYILNQEWTKQLYSEPVLYYVQNNLNCWKIYFVDTNFFLCHNSEHVNEFGLHCLDINLTLIILGL